MSEINKKRDLKISDKQKKMLVEYIKSNPQLSSGRFSQIFTQKDSEALWIDLSTNLNSTRAAKSWQNWRKVKLTKYSIIHNSFNNFVVAGYSAQNQIQNKQDKILCQYNRRWPTFAKRRCIDLNQSKKRKLKE